MNQTKILSKKTQNSNMDPLYRFIKQGKLLKSYEPSSFSERKEIDDYLSKIKNYCKTNGCDESKVINGLTEYPEFRHFFEKNPKKQSKEETQQFEIIKKVVDNNVESETGYKKVTIGRSSGKGSKKEYEFRIDENGNILSGSRKFDSDPESKTFDTVISLEKSDTILDVYISQKDTGGGSENSSQGGAQSSVGEEMGRTARYCLKNKENNKLFIFYLDSSYWNRIKKNNEKTEFEHFKQEYECKNILVTNSKYFKNDFINHIKMYYYGE